MTEELSPLNKIVPETPWTMSYWHVSQMESLSFRALGVHTYLMSLPTGWKISAERVARNRKEGRDAVEAALRELKAAGLYTVTKVRGDDGKFSTITTVYAIPQDAKPQVAPKPGYQGSVNQGSVNQGSKNRRQRTEDLEKDSPPPKSSSAQPPALVEEPKSEEEEYPKDLKTFVATLDYHGQVPSPVEYRRIAAQLLPLWGKVDPGDLRRRLQDNAGIGAQSLVAVYVSRLKSFKPQDFALRKGRGGTPNVGAVTRRRIWCDRPGVCDPRTSRLIDDQGYVSKQTCPLCRSR